MKCPQCEAKTDVIDSRACRRRRRCRACGHRFNTQEVITEEPVQAPPKDRVKVEAKAKRKAKEREKKETISMPLVKRQAAARRRLEDMRDEIVEIDSWDYLPEV